MVSVLSFLSVCSGRIHGGDAHALKISGRELVDAASVACLELNGHQSIPGGRGYANVPDLLRERPGLDEDIDTPSHRFLDAIVVQPQEIVGRALAG